MSNDRDAVAPAPRGRDDRLSPSCIALHGVNLTPLHGQEALEALEQVSERLHALGDPRGAFAEVYGVITRRVLVEARKPRSSFLEPGWINRLMGRFCARYLQTLAWSLRGLPQDCEAWRVTYLYADAGLTIPLQDVLFGISAHINYDLALGIAQTILEYGHASDVVMLTRYKHDHDFVNELLRESIPESVARLRDRYGCRTTDLAWLIAEPLMVRAAMAVLGVWREHVWGDVLRLLAGSSAGERRALLRAMDLRSARIGQAIAGLSAGWLLGRAVLPLRAWFALRNLLVTARAAGWFRRLGDIDAPCRLEAAQQGADHDEP